MTDAGNSAPLPTAGARFMSEVRATMKQRGVTQWSLAKRAGMDHRNMSRLLRGGKRGPWLSTLETIANALGMNLRVTLEKKP